MICVMIVVPFLPLKNPYEIIPIRNVQENNYIILNLRYLYDDITEFYGVKIKMCASDCRLKLQVRITFSASW